MSTQQSSVPDLKLIPGGGRSKKEQKKRAASIRKRIYVAATVLIVLGLVSAYLGHPQQNAAGTTDHVTISERNGWIDEDVVASITPDELRDMKPVSVEVTEQVDGQLVSNIYTGVEVSELIQHVKPSMMNNAEAYIFSSPNGYAFAVSPGDVKKKKTIMVAYEKDGEDMEPEGSEGGPLRVVYARELQKGRHTMLLSKIVCRYGRP
ncbi:MAG: molybdopterin-dependent oxidoreductase [Anaerovoracaceae bacterium]|jgi:hypothetical protein